jgi:hypothetical protein
MAAPTQVLHGDWSARIDADTLIGEPVVCVDICSAELPPAKARELARALTTQADLAERIRPMRASEQMRNALIRAALKQSPRRFTDSPITGFGEL